MIPSILMPVRVVFVLVMAWVSVLSQTGCRTVSPGSSAPAEIELQYDQKLAAIGFPSPLLIGTIHGQTVRFIIDTGASVHTLASWVVTEARMPTNATNATSTGSTGSESTVRVVNKVSIRVNGRKDDLLLREGIVVDFPPIFQQQRIGGLLSPQLLAPASWAAVLDLAAPRLSFGAATAVSTGSRVCRNQDSPFVNRLYAASMSMGNLEGTMLVDTGATSSLVVPSSPIAAALSGRASVSGRTQGIGGSATITRKVPGVILKFGGGEANLVLTIGGARSSCGVDGLLGMDALRGCRLTLGPSTFAWSCRPVF